MNNFDQSLLDAFQQAAAGTLAEIEALRERLAEKTTPVGTPKTPIDEAHHCIVTVLNNITYIGFGQFNAVSEQLEAYVDLRLPITDRKLPDDLKCIKLIDALKKEVDAFARTQSALKP